MNLLLYLLPLSVFIVISIVMYIISADEDKNDFSKILTRNVFPALVVGLLVFAIIKFKDSGMFNPEPMMKGNYFE